jgi:hypothetical protein
MASPSLPHTRDVRYCPPERVFGIMQKTLLAFPVMGLESSYERLCVPIQMDCKVIHGNSQQQQDGAAHMDDLMMEERHAQCSETDPKLIAEEAVSVYTWKAAASRLVTIIKTMRNQTVVYDHASRGCFVAAPMASLSTACPVGTSLLGQVVVDRLLPERTGTTESHGEGGDQEEWKASIVIFDILSYGKDHNFLDTPRKASLRYSMLRSVQEIFAESCLRVQWAGNLQALMEFEAENKDNLPHIFDALIQLGVNFPNKARLVRWATQEEDDFFHTRV